MNENHSDSDTARVDFSTVATEQDVHEIFARTLRFPHFYGHNWNAFWDVLTGFGCFPKKLILENTEHLRRAVPDAYDQLQQCFADCEREYPYFAPFVVWQ